MKRQVSVDQAKYATKKVKFSPRPLVSRALSSYTNAAIKKAIASSRETKKVFTSLLEAQLTTVVGAGYYAYSFPKVSYGSLSHQRVGNQINPIKMHLKLLLHNNADEPIHVRVLVVRVRQGSQMGDSGIGDNIFDGEAGVDNTLSGAMSDIMRPINLEELHVQSDKVITLGVNSGGFPRSPVAVSDLTFTPLKTMTYADGNLEDPVTDRYALVIIPRQANNDESLGSQFELSYQMTMLYKD